jgi:small-conductance mechanosensitive channel
MGEFGFRALAADPFVQIGLLAVSGAVLVRILLRKYPTHRLIFQSVLFVALTTLLYHYRVAPYEIAPSETPTLERVFIALAKIIWWLNAAWVFTGCVRVFLIFERRPREGRLIQDLIVGLIYLSAALSIMAYVFSAPVGTLIATSGVFAIILGLALQSTLADVFSGIALNFSKPYEVSDWIVLQEGLEGRVVETNWRATHLLNASNDLVVVPNSVLAKAKLTNLSSPNRSHGAKVRIRIVPTTAPSAVSEVLQTALFSSNSIMAAPAPLVEIKSLDAQAIEFELSFRVKDFAASAAARHEVYDLIYRHVRAAGLQLALPAEASAVTVGQMPVPAAAATRSTEMRLLDAVPLFASLTEAEKEALAGTLTRKAYRKGDVLVEQGAKLDALMVIRNGVVAVMCHQGKAKGEVELGRLAPGDYFGEGGLFTGSGETGAVHALTATVVYEVGQAALGTLMRDRPSIADEISVTLSRRTKVGSSEAGLSDEDGPRSVSWLVARIRELFEVPHA